ncbi:MAG: thioredoxin family protein [Flavobacteriales bacterium]|nr:thioredoxin family protein [Flavobacteriales bacterium]
MKIERIIIDRGYRFEEYRKMVESLFEAGKVTGTDQREDLIQYTKLNIQRMKRIDKTVSISPKVADTISKISQPLTWLVITEGWCGDASQITPVLAKMAEINPLIKLCFVLRDENTELMDHFLTNGGRAIPVLICADENGEVISWWGPRPTEARQIVADLKVAGETDHQVIMEKVHAWYAKNKGEAIQGEIAALIEKCLEPAKAL